MSEQMFSFETAQFRVVATIEPDEDLDLSFDETGEVAEDLDAGRSVAFRTCVEVLDKQTGAVLGSDHLGGSIYTDPSRFFESHRDSPDSDRNTLANKARGVVIGHYFPDMVRVAVAEARRNLAHVARLAG